MSEENFGEKMLSWVNANSKKIFVSILVLVAAGLLVMGGLWFYLSNNKHFLARLDGEEISMTEFNGFAYGIVMKGTPTEPDLLGSGLERETILKNLVESKILKKEADSLGIAVKKEDVNKFILEKYPDFDVDSVVAEQIYQYQEFLYLKELITQKVVGIREGKFVFARDDVYQPDPARAMNADDRANVEKNIAYTKTFIDDIYQKLLSKKITFDEAIKVELNDTFIGENVPSENGSLHSGAFGSDDFASRTGVMTHEEVYQAVLALKKGEITKPIYLSSVDLKGEKISVGWVIASITETNNEGGSSYDNWYQEKLNQHKVLYGGIL